MEISAKKTKLMTNDTSGIKLLTHMKNVSLGNDQCEASWPSDPMQQKLFDVVIFSDTINMINVRLCTMVVLTELYPFIQFLVTLIVLFFGTLL